MKHLSLILILLVLGISSAKAETGKIELLCNGVGDDWVRGILKHPVTGVLIVVDHDSNTVNVSGWMGGEYLITKITKTLKIT